MVKWRLTIVELSLSLGGIRGEFEEEWIDAERNNDIMYVFADTYRYVYVISYNIGRNAGNSTRSRTISRFVLSILGYRCPYLWYQRVTSDIFVAGICNRRLLYDYWRLIAFAGPSHQSLTTDREKLETFTRFHRIYNTIHVCCDCWPDLCMQTDYGNVTNCYKAYRVTMLSDYLINLVG